MVRTELINLFRQMLTIRMFEERVREEYTRGRIVGMIHLYIGQEAVAAGVCSNLEKTDLITSHHRGHGHFIAKGADLKMMMAELFGKATGYCKGKGGSMHIADLHQGHLGANGIVGGGIPIATGAALGLGLLHEKEKVVVCFFGDGALNTGIFHESLNLAALWKLPVVYVCENNLYALSTSVANSCSIEDVAKRAGSYGIPGKSVDGMDMLAVKEASREAIHSARSGKGPAILICNTYRFLGHGRNPDTGSYRTKEEESEWRARCPVANLEKKLLQERAISARELSSMQEEIRREIDAAVQFAEESPLPAIEELERDIYA